jgi:hypothetical protein
MCLFVKAAAAHIMQRPKRWAKPMRLLQNHERTFVPGGGGPQPADILHNFGTMLGENLNSVVSRFNAIVLAVLARCCRPSP